MAIYARSGGAWRQMSPLYAKQGGQWRKVRQGWVQENGQWRSFYTDIFYLSALTVGHLSENGTYYGYKEGEFGSINNAIVAPGFGSIPATRIITLTHSTQPYFGSSQLTIEFTTGTTTPPSVPDFYYLQVGDSDFYQQDAYSSLLNTPTGVVVRLSWSGVPNPLEPVGESYMIRLMG